MESIQLSNQDNSSPEGVTYDKEKCVMCQEASQEKLVSTSNGCKRIRDASEIRNDLVTKRIKLLPANSHFFYHVSNKCYKRYTHATLLKKLQVEGNPQQSSDETGSPDGILTRSHSAVRSPRNPVDSKTVTFSNCTICGNKSYKCDFTKFRISESSRATSFLEAANFFQDDVFSRICDLQDEHAVFGADLHYHKNCMTKYLHKFESAQSSTDEPQQMNPKQRAWSDIVSELEVGLKSGNGYELTSIRDRLNRVVDEEHQFRNRDVKVFLVRQFGNSIDFTYPDEFRKSLMVYSVPCNRAEDLAQQLL